MGKVLPRVGMSFPGGRSRSRGRLGRPRGPPGWFLVWGRGRSGPSAVTNPAARHRGVGGQGSGYSICIFSFYLFACSFQPGGWNCFI